jgi:autotransporter-associated beta strand protein
LLSFLPAVNYPVGPGPQNTAVGDFNGDGIPDLAVAGFGEMSVLLGQGDGTFQFAGKYPSGGSGYGSIVAGVFRTGSGILDLAVANSYSGDVTILLGNGDGTFQSPVLVAGGFQEPTLTTTPAPDLDQDGNLDLVVANQQGTTVSVLLGNGDGTFQPRVDYTLNTPNFHNPRHVKAADFRGIGVLDLVVTPASGQAIAVLPGNGDGTFQDPAYYPAGDPSNVQVGPLRTGSGILDLAVTNRFDNTLSVLLGNGDGTFQPPVSYPIGTSSSYPALDVGDFNQDGNLDLVATNFGGGTVSVLLGNGDGTFQAPASYAVGSNPDWVLVGDFNGDGYPDLAVNNFGSNSVSILLNDQVWGGQGGSRGGSAATDRLPGQVLSVVVLAQVHARLPDVPATALPATPPMGEPLLSWLPEQTPDGSTSDAPSGIRWRYALDGYYAAHPKQSPGLDLEVLNSPTPDLAPGSG